MRRPEIVLLLTATVDPSGMTYVSRNDPNQRRNDYRKTLIDFLADSATPPIVFCENSGDDLGWAEQVTRTHNPYAKPVELMSFSGNHYPRRLGKGYGEIGIIAYALAHSRMVQPETRVLKVTGRYFVNNIRYVTQRLGASRKDIDVFADLRGNLTYCDSRVFCATSTFLQTYLVPLKNEADDSAGMVFENVLARAIHSGMVQGMSWAMLPCSPVIRGNSGSSDRTYPTSVVSFARREIFRYLKTFILSR